MQNTKKILFVHHNSVPGGAELSLYDLVTNLSPAVTPVCAVPEGPLREKLTDAGIKTYAVPMRQLTKSLNLFEQLASGSAWLKVHAKIKEICKKEKINIIHANSLPAVIYTAKAARASKIPMLWHERDMAVHSILTPQVAKFAKRIIAISKAVAKNLELQLKSSYKIRLIYNGTEVAKFANPSRDALPALPVNKRKVLMASQFVEWKGHQDFIEAAKLVKQQISDTVFILAGTKKRPEQQEYITRLEATISANGLEADFNWLGFVDNMPGLLSEVDAVVVPSHGEPFGRIVVEAMAAEKALVAYDSGAIPELIENGKSGCLVDDGDINGLANSICKILSNNDFAATIAKEANLRVSRNFTIQRTIEEFEELVSNIKNDLISE